MIPNSRLIRNLKRRDRGALNQSFNKVKDKAQPHLSTAFYTLHLECPRTCSDANNIIIVLSCLDKMYSFCSMWSNRTYVYACFNNVFHSNYVGEPVGSNPYKKSSCSDSTIFNFTAFTVQYRTGDVYKSRSQEAILVK